MRKKYTWRQNGHREGEGGLPPPLIVLLVRFRGLPMWSKSPIQEYPKTTGDRSEYGKRMPIYMSRGIEKPKVSIVN